MSLFQVEDRLQAHWRLLQHHWGRSCDLWHDPVRERFERAFWQEFEHLVPTTLKEMLALAELISQARAQVP